MCSPGVQMILICQWCGAGVGTYGSAYLVCLVRDPSQQYVLKKVSIDPDYKKDKQQAEVEVDVLAHLSHPLVLGWVL
jgi:hypothetical protein